MSEDNDESRMLVRALEWLQIDQNSQKDDPLKQLILPTQSQTMIHRAIAEVSQSRVNRVWLTNISTRFCFIREERDFPITEATVFDLYHGRKICLSIVDKACYGIDSTFYVLSVVPIKLEESCWLVVMILFSKPKHFACIAEINLKSSEFIIHQVENLDFADQTDPPPFTILLPNWDTNVPSNNMTLFLCIHFDNMESHEHGKEIDLKYSPPKTRIPTMNIRNGLLYFFWELSVRHFIGNTVYGFQFESADSSCLNYNELIVAEWENFPPYSLKNIERRKISGFSEYGDGNCFKPTFRIWHGEALYLLRTNISNFEVIFFTLETLVWRSVVKFEHNLFKEWIYLAVEENELVLSFAENHNSLNAWIYDCIIFPVGRPLSLSKLALFSVYHFNHKDSKYGRILELIQLQASLKPLPNSKKLQSIQDEEFQDFCKSFI